MPGCFCTGRCRRPGGVCPVNGPVEKPPVGWICPRCGNVNSPASTRCQTCPISTPAPPSQPWVIPWRQPRPVPMPTVPAPNVPRPMPICGCTSPVCMNTACPHRVQVTCSVSGEAQQEEIR